VEGKDIWLFLHHHVSHDTRTSDRDLKQGHPEYEEGVQRCSAPSSAAKCGLSSSTQMPSIVNSNALIFKSFRTSVRVC
jgi:hypothetical protein